MWARPAIQIPTAMIPEYRRGTVGESPPSGPVDWVFWKLDAADPMARSQNDPAIHVLPDVHTDFPLSVTVEPWPRALLIAAVVIGLAVLIWRRRAR